MSKKEDFLSLVGKKIKCVRVTTTGSDRISGVSIEFTGGARIEISELWDEAVGWMPFDVSITKGLARGQ